MDAYHTVLTDKFW